ncbi:ComEC/Rec2 family competence protein, partial [Patescibacteria group bacterium]
MFSPSKVISLLVSLILIGFFLLPDLPRDFQVSFLNIGQGDAIYIRTPDDYHAMIDSGPSMNVLENLAEVMPRYSRTLDLLILTHPHADHINGFVDILKRYDVKRVMIVGTPSYNPYYRKILTLVDDVELIYARADQDIKLGSYIYIDVVWPAKLRIGEEFENKNDASIAVRVVGLEGSFMLTGDAEHDEEAEILESGFDLSAEVYKAGH